MTNYELDLAYRQKLAYSADREREQLYYERWKNRTVDSEGNICLPDFSDHCTETFCKLLENLTRVPSRTTVKKSADLH